MRVLLWMVNSGDGIQGGHQIQIQQTARHLEQLGVSTEIAHDRRPAIEAFDVVHNFGLDPPELRRCRNYGIPVVTSTIYWARDYALGVADDVSGLRRWLRRARTAMVLARSAWRGTHPEKCEALTARQWKLRVVYEMSDLLLPNSQSEADAIYRELGVSTPHLVAPNAVAPELFPLPDRAAPRQGVLFVGRFEPHKNQLGLIRAMRRTNIPLTIMGYAHPHHGEYHRQCVREASRTSHIRIAPPLEHGQLVHAYQQARVHVLPSWFETTGLVSLEAALSGCNIVTTSRGYTREFFQDLAWYCDPASPQTIRQAIQAAYEAPYSTDLRQRILDRYTWHHTAEATLRGYQKVLALGQRRCTMRENQAAEVNADA